MKTQNPLIGRSKGSAGGMTASKVYDKNVLRAKAFEVNNPNTQAQQNERNFFTQCQRINSTASEEMLRTLFPIKPKSMSRRNALMKQLMSNKEEDGSEFIFYPQPDFSLGNGPKCKGYYLDEFEATDDVFVTNIPLHDFGVEESISIHIVVYNLEKEALEVHYIGTYDSQTFDLEMLVTDAGLTEGTRYFGYLTASTSVTNSQSPLGSYTLKSVTY